MRNLLLARLLPLAAALALVSAAPAALADGQRDHEQARAALQAGDILPLHRVLQQVAQAYPGQVMAVELEREPDRWIYELKLLQPGGALVKLEVDAKSGEVLRHRERRR